MASAKGLRKRIRNAISESIKSEISKIGSSSLPSRLDKIFADFATGNSTSNTVECGDDDRNDDDSITPLMFACDQKCAGALSYLLSQLRAASSDEVKTAAPIMSTKQIIDAWGSPKDKSSSGNRAAHHVMAAGFNEGIDLIYEIQGFFEDKEKGRPMGQCAHLPTNNNGDTPIMMACAFGHFSTLQRLAERMILSTLLDAHAVSNAMTPHALDGIEHNVLFAWNAFRHFFGTKNSEGLTAFNLACGHGHVDVVKLLIEQVHVRVDSSNSSYQVSLIRASEENKSSQEASEDTSHIHLIKMSPLARLSYFDLEFCQATMDKIVDAMATLKCIVKKKNREGREKEYESQYQRTRECYCIVGNELTRIANETARELWCAESSSTFVASKSGKSKKKKQRLKTLPNQVLSATREAARIEVISPNTAIECSDNISSDGHMAIQVDDLAIEGIIIDSLPIVTTREDSIMPTSQSSGFVSPTVAATCLRTSTRNLDETPLIPTLDSKPKPLHRILQSTSLPASKDDEDIVALMDSLCLEPSMLLYSPHEMAIEMSPCQLDVIEDILKQQLNAIKNAQEIHARLLNK